MRPAHKGRVSQAMDRVARSKEARQKWRAFLLEVHSQSWWDARSGTRDAASGTAALRGPAQCRAPDAVAG
jgi:hypothetical protein